MSRYSIVEERILQALQQWLDSYRLNWEGGALQDEEMQITIKRKAISVEQLLSVYHELPDAQSKNDMLKDVLERIEYIKTEASPRNGPYDNFELILYPKLPTKR